MEKVRVAKVYSVNEEKLREYIEEGKRRLDSLLPGGNAPSDPLTCEDVCDSRGVEPAEAEAEHEVRKCPKCGRVLQPFAKEQSWWCLVHGRIKDGEVTYPAVRGPSA